tara:strand:- start:91 stop:1050 length:960 start_codon:yes stop_codon:yes gene_type:complete
MFALLCACAHSRLVGFHVDDESCSGLLNYGHNRSEQTIKCAKFFASLANLSATLAAESSALEKRGAGSWAKLQLAVDAGTAWSCPTGTKECFNLTFGGKTVSVAEHVIDLADEAVIMDYDRSPTSLYTRAKPYLDYADSLDPKLGKEVSVGVAIAQWNDTKAPSWQTKSEAEMERLMSDSIEQMQMHRSFKGFAVFTEGNWKGQAEHSSKHQQHGDSTFHAAGAWYIDHKVVLNQTARAEWLKWAASRSVSALYIAPHAGNTALISIPGVEGSPEDDVKFCDFIHLADKQGLDVSLLSTPTTDWSFVQNCTARRPNDYS